ncbi:MAG TPA: formate dehydrogenase accessory sulfurtransferase FdhD [Actinomycetes bacterium]|nr:formate dehydrogenase accessory sulfurtransferase FdhD [Actinomycetes bacterium]
MTSDTSEVAPRPGPSTRARVRVLTADGFQDRADLLATEEPMEIRLQAPDGSQRTVAVTMRTPGRDFELAAGFLYGEGVLADPDEVRRISYCADPELTEEERYNVVTVDLTGPLPELPALERHFMINSACGVCGKESLEALRLRGCVPLGAGPVLRPDLFWELPDRLRSAQAVFARTGGLHAAGLFSAAGELLGGREDVGRHNAVDKLVGWAFLDRRLPLDECLLMVSGRASYEIMQKALAARIPAVAAVSAPSSLAVALARDFDMTLVGFVRGRRFNVYADPGRIAPG